MTLHAECVLKNRGAGSFLNTTKKYGAASKNNRNVPNVTGTRTRRADEHVVQCRVAGRRTRRPYVMLLAVAKGDQNRQ